MIVTDFEQVTPDDPQGMFVTMTLIDGDLSVWSKT
jgi:hypothetical protein